MATSSERTDFLCITNQLVVTSTACAVKALAANGLLIMQRPACACSSCVYVLQRAHRLKSPFRLQNLQAHEDAAEDGNGARPAAAAAVQAAPDDNAASSSIF